MESGGIVLISACLTGRKTRYDGESTRNEELMECLRGRRWIAVCPEQLGGMTTPRAAANLVGGDGHDVLAGLAKVVDIKGNDVTRYFMKGACMVLDFARRVGASEIYLKDRSPSCGLHPLVDENGNARGRGVTAALLTENGFRLIEVRARSNHPM